jgi:hypothetical protein
MNLLATLTGGVGLIVMCLVVIRPHGRKKEQQSSYSKTELFTLGLAAIVASIILLIKFQ